MEFLGGLLMAFWPSVPGLVRDWLNHRYRLREIAVQGSLADLMRRRDRVGSYYPLGVPGRLVGQDDRGGGPAILVAPMSAPANTGLGDVPARVHDLLREQDDFRRYARIVTGAFVADGPSVRTISGSVGAAEVAHYEFTGRPAVIVYFEASARLVVAEAYLSRVFETTTAGTGFPFVIARYGWGQVPGSDPMRTRDSDIPSWEYIDLQAAGNGVSPADVVAHTVAWFLYAVVDAYWRSRGVPTALLGRSVRALVAAPGSASSVASITVTSFPSKLRARLERDAGALSDAGYQVAAERLPNNLTRLDVTGRGRTVAFVLATGYPDTAPGVIVFHGKDPEPIEIDAATWSAERTLAEIMEGVP